MYINILLKGIAVGFCVAMPIGPIGILCIQRTLSQGRIYGIIYGLGAATADAIYGTIASFGVSFISTSVLQKKFLIKLISGIFLFIVGAIKILHDNLISTTPTIKKTNLINDYYSAFFFTLTNPITIIIFATIFSWSWINIEISELSYIYSLLLILGIFLGSALWFTTLSLIVGAFRKKFSTKYLTSINTLSGIIIITFGIFTLISLFIK